MLPLYSLEPLHFYKVLQKMNLDSFQNLQLTGSGVKSALKERGTFRRSAPKGDVLIVHVRATNAPVYFVKEMTSLDDEEVRKRHVEAFSYHHFTHVRVDIAEKKPVIFLDSLTSSLTTNRITCKYLTISELSDQSVDYTDLCTRLQADHVKILSRDSPWIVPFQPMASVTVHLTVDFSNATRALQNTIGKHKDIYIKLSNNRTRRASGEAGVENIMAGALNMLSSTATKENFCHLRLVYSTDCCFNLPTNKRLREMLKKTRCITPPLEETTYWKYTHAEQKHLNQGQQTALNLVTERSTLCGMIEMDQHGCDEKYYLEMNVGNVKLRNGALKYWDFALE